MQARQQGLTLIEMMIALAILGIVMTIVLPSAQSILNQNRIIAEINEMSGLIQFARATAIDEQTDTTLCPTVDYTNCNAVWDNPKMVFIDEDNNGIRGADEELLASINRVANANDLTGPANAIVFFASGAVNNVSTLLMCHNNNDAKLARELHVSAQGRVKISQDVNNDGVHESFSGADLNCL